MICSTRKRALFLPVIGYAAAACLALRFARFDGGVAYVWGANAVLAAVLSTLPRGRWWEVLLPCFFAGWLTNGLWGLGWQLAPGLAFGNMADVVVAVALLRRLTRTADARIPKAEPTPPLLPFVAAMGLAGPATSTLLATLTVMLSGRPPSAPLALTWFIGHGLGMLAFYPGLLVIVRGTRRAGTPLAEKAPRHRAWPRQAGVLLLFTAACLYTFAQQGRPLLFVPTLVLAAAIAWAETATLALAYGILALVGGAFTAMGHGPIALMAVSMPQRMQMLQIYLALSVVCTLPMASIVHRRVQLLARMRESEARYRLLADNSTDIILSTDAAGRIRFVSPSVLLLAHHQPAELIGRLARDFVVPEHRAQAIAAHLAAMRAPGSTITAEFLGLVRYGEPRWFESRMRAVAGDDGRVECVVNVVRDMSRRKEYETALALAALTDPLTGLPNRRLFRNALEDCIANAGCGCVALIDLDHFKLVNDRHGHAAGDAVLKSVAAAARAALRGSDTFARMGGEEFALLLPGASLEVAQGVCRRLASTLAATTTEHEGQAIRITCSVGLARLGRDADTAMAAADRALYDAK
ncbi:MAG TPA: diguanylate cyclase, partial [Novosphingobium sp.]|nr:diguanylate cyclase [Novosphingobium sp.]